LLLKKNQIASIVQAEQVRLHTAVIAGPVLWTQGRSPAARPSFGKLVLRL